MPASSGTWDKVWNNLNLEMLHHGGNLPSPSNLSLPGRFPQPSSFRLFFSRVASYALRASNVRCPLAYPIPIATPRSLLQTRSPVFTP